MTQVLDMTILAYLQIRSSWIWLLRLSNMRFVWIMMAQDDVLDLRRDASRWNAYTECTIPGVVLRLFIITVSAASNLGGLCVSLMTLLSCYGGSCLVVRVRTTRETEGQISEAGDGDSFYRGLITTCNNSYEPGLQLLTQDPDTPRRYTTLYRNSCRQ